MTIDLTTFMIGDGRQYDVTNTWNGSSERMQTQVDPSDKRRFYHVKNSNWEELWATDKAIYRGTDTSPGDNEVYQLFEDNVYGSLWAPRYIELNKPFKRVASVVFKHRDSGSLVAKKPAYIDTTWIVAHAVHSAYTFHGGIKLNSVLELHANVGPTFNKNSFEIYLYAKNYGLVGWIGQGVGKSFISNDFGHGQPALSRMNLDWVKSFQKIHDLKSAAGLIVPGKVVTPTTPIIQNPLFVGFPGDNASGWSASRIAPVNDFTNIRKYPTVDSDVAGKIVKSSTVYSINVSKMFNDGKNTWLPLKIGNVKGWARTDIIVLVK